MKSEFKKLNYMVGRNIKLYFKDKLTFFVSMITPLILVLLFILFLKNVYEDSLISALRGAEISKSLLNGFTGSWLFSSILATSCITVSFCSGMMVYDKINKITDDFRVAPIKKSTIQLSYVISNFCVTMIVCLVLFGVSLIYLGIVGFYLSFVDCLLIIVNMAITVLFGCLLANSIWFFVSSNGALSGVCTLVSSMYGFICGAYMPLSSMGKGIQGFASFLPGTYSTVIFRQCYMNGALEELSKNFPPEAINGIREGFDCTFSFFGTELSTTAMFLVISLSTLVLLGIFLAIASVKIRKKKKDTNTQNNNKLNSQPLSK